MHQLWSHVINTRDSPHTLNALSASTAMGWIVSRALWTVV